MEASKVGNYHLFKKFISGCTVFIAAGGLSLVAVSGGSALVVVLRLLTAVVSPVEHRL